jgi:hypothetical protein
MIDNGAKIVVIQQRTIQIRREVFHNLFSFSEQQKYADEMKEEYSFLSKTGKAIT